MSNFNYLKKSSMKKEFSREERAEISKKFREEIKNHGIQSAILTVVDSTSDKTEVRKTVLAQQCRKKDFAEKFRKACEFLLKSVDGTEKKLAIMQLRKEML